MTNNYKNKTNIQANSVYQKHTQKEDENLRQTQQNVTLLNNQIKWNSIGGIFAHSPKVATSLVVLFSGDKNQTKRINGNCKASERKKEQYIKYVKMKFFFVRNNKRAMWIVYSKRKCDKKISNMECYFLLHY
jgi:hypothetical protein